MAQVYGVRNGGSRVAQGLKQLRHGLQALLIRHVCWVLKSDVQPEAGVHMASFALAVVPTPRDGFEEVQH